MARTPRRRAARPHFDRLESRALLAGDPALSAGSSLIARFIDGAPTARDQAILDVLGASVVRGFADGASLIALKRPSGLGRALVALQADRGVEFAVPDGTVHALKVPNDANFGQQWALSNPSGPDIGAARAWDITTGGNSTIVAVVDSGVNYAHPDLYANIALNQGEIPAAIRSRLVDTAGDGRITIRDLNSLDARGVVVLGADGKPVNSAYVTDLNANGYIDAGDLLADPRWADGQDGDGNNRIDDLAGWNFITNTNKPMDDLGHGTVVSGIIGASGNNGLGVAGINWDVQILPLKFLGSNGSGSDSDAMAAIDYAADLGARVINASWGDPVPSPSIQSAINYAGGKNAVFVAAAGNSGKDNDTSPFYPSSNRLPNVLSVAATDQAGNLAGFSNYGANSVDLAAPGSNILSTGSVGGYVSGSGTSFAAPQVSGVVALLAGLHPEYTAVQLVQRIKATVKPLPGLLGKTVTGGLLDAFGALNFPPASPPATLDYSGGFAGASGLGLTNKASISGTRLRLTDGGAGEAASAFTTAKVGVANFSTQFSFQLTNAQADGFTFAIQGGPPTSKIWGGTGLGSWQLARSAAVKFDLYNSAGEGSNSTGLFLNGAKPTVGGVAPSSGSVNLQGTGVDLHSGDVMTAALTYDGATLTVKLTDTKTGASASQAYAVDIPSVVGGSTAYVGFTAGTGGLSAVQDILDWTYTSGSSTPPVAVTKPSAPGGLTASAASPTRIDLSWTDTSANEDNFLVEQSADGVNFARVASLPPDSTSCSILSLSPATTYTFRVRASNAAGASAYSNAATATTPPASSGPTVDHSGGFAGASGMTLTNKASISGTRLRLTDGAGQAASAYAAAKVGVAKFATQFTFQLANAQADGFTFLIQGGTPTAKVFGGAGLGSWQVPRSVAVKFDLSNNAGEGSNSTGLFLNGAYPSTGGVAPSSGAVNLDGSGIDLHSGDVMTAAIAYDGATLTVKLTDSRTGASATQAYAVNIPSVVGGSTAYVGFTAGTGGVGAIQDILDWTYTATA